MLMLVNMKSRSYVLKARGTAQQGTHQRILRAGTDVMWEKVTTEITLEDVATRAAVSVQTVLRHFGTREGLLAAVVSFLEQEVVEERRAPVGDVPEAVRILFDHYELRGDAVLRLLSQEYWNEGIRVHMDKGRQAHRQWVEVVFGPHLEAHTPDTRDELTDLLVVATDVYTWKLLRRDRALERAHAEQRVMRLIEAILARKTAT